MSPSSSRRRSERDRDSRSRSPPPQGASTHRRRSPHRKTGSPSARGAQIELPFEAQPLLKHDYDYFEPMLALYLDVKKGLDLDRLSKKEVQGRWKSFMGKWNRGELSEGWYDPSTLEKASEDVGAGLIMAEQLKGRRRDYTDDQPSRPRSDSADSVGPQPLEQAVSRTSMRAGPRVPTMQDLEFRKEQEQDDRSAQRSELAFARKLDRKAQKDALNELVPRAEAGTRERQLEKKQEVNAKMRAFREKSPGAAEVPEADLMGDGDGIDGYKKQRQQFERKKNDRELRREEFLRARQAEREERMQEFKAKEDATMAMLKDLAKQRFGDGESS